MNRLTENERERREEEGAVNPSPTVRHICGLTQTGKQAALLRKPQTIPQRNSGPAVRLRVRVSGSIVARERETPQLSIGHVAYLFEQPLPL